MFTFLEDSAVVKLREKILAEIELTSINSPVSGYSLVSKKIASGDTLELFDNQLGLDPLPNNQQVRGIILLVKYPALDDLGEDLLDEKRSINIILSNGIPASPVVNCSIPMYNYYSLINNPVTENLDHLIEGYKNQLKITDLYSIRNSLLCQY